MVRISVICVILLVVCVALPALAQTPLANTITCSSGTACKKGTIPVFTTAGGAAKVDSSIVSQTGTSLKVAGNETVTTNISAGGSVNATTSFDLGGTSFAFGSVSNQNASLGFAGNLTMTGVGNTAVGASALIANTTGMHNSALGASALSANTTGTGNSAFGYLALSANTTGVQNEAFGSGTLSANTTGIQNAAFGLAALAANTTGASNSAFGYGALTANTTGIQNEAFGIDALIANTTGNGNAAFGGGALAKNTTGGSSTKTGGNSAFGNFALFTNTTAGGNSAFGYSALTVNTTGNNNVAFGAAALAKLTSGGGNIAVGTGAGGNLSAAESNNIYVGNSGIAGESNVIRIGFIGTQKSAFIAGISGQTSANGVAVLVNGAGQLGTTTSSRRFKHQIVDMGAESDVLMKLRPVAFYYKPELDETQTRQYGLVAEEVAEVAPQLVVFDKDGAPQTVRYHFVNAMLMNEVQKQRQLVEEQQKTNEEQNSTIARQQEEIQDLVARMVKLETLLAAKR
jgi:trimeric autotransporter adhesin